MIPEFSVVVPVCNEAENVEPLAREIHAALGDRAYEMIFIDDGSTDETAAILMRLKSEFPALRVLRHSFRSGQSAAVASGVRAARTPLATAALCPLRNEWLNTRKAGSELLSFLRMAAVSSVLPSFTKIIS